MKKLLLLLLFVSGVASAQAPPFTITFPDPAFYNRLIAIGGIDSNTDGYITQGEASNPLLSSLDLINTGITDLTGIEYFTSLTTLNCSQNSLPSLDVTFLVALQTLICKNDGLTAITGLNSLTSLNYLDCSSNSISLLNTSTLTTLASLDCHNNNLGPGSLFLAPNLTFLDCGFNPLMGLNVSGQSNLQRLGCQSIQTSSSSLILPTSSQLLDLYCMDNLLTTLDVTNQINLQFLACEQNQLTTLYFSTCTHLTNLRCAVNQLISVDVSMIGGLVELICDRNPLTTLVIDPTVNANLTFLSYGSPTLNNYDPSPLIGLTSLYCYNQTVLDLHLLTNLQLVYIRDLTVQTTLDLSMLTNLNQLSLFDSSLSYLNIKNGTPVTSQIYTNFSLVNICANDSDVAALITSTAGWNGSNLQINSYCSFTPGGSYNTISGVTYFGCSPGDPIINNVKIGIIDNLNNSGATFTNNLGNYNFNVQQPTLTVMPILDVPSYFTVTPPSQIINVTPPFNNPLQNQIVDFCIVPSGYNPDLEVVIVPIGQARPGFQANYKVIYKNIGNQSIASGSVTLSYDSRAHYYYSSPPTLTPPTWTYLNLLPLETRVIEVAFNLNTPTATPPLNGGDHLLFTASIPLIPDVKPLDNTMTYNQTVVNSFDPNDKTCLEGDIIDPAKIGEYLHYNINFENTGTADAINIVVKDVIDATKFDINTLQLLDASHPVNVKITGDVAEFIFEGINLPPTVTQPTLSHGNVSFKIKTLPTLVTGDVVANTANIYFDYNAPIQTNTATSTFAILSNAGFVVDHSVTVYPNPTKNNVTVTAKTDIKSIQIFDVQGRILQTVIENKTSTLLDISTKQNGVYFLKVTTKDGSSVEKIIKE